MKIRIENANGIMREFSSKDWDTIISFIDDGQEAKISVIKDSADRVTEREKEKIEHIIMNDESVLRQIRAAKRKREKGTSIYISNDEDFDRLAEEVNREV
jgi:vacuolar-type H+-ATPase subunit E/Vma4